MQFYIPTAFNKMQPPAVTTCMLHVYTYEVLPSRQHNPKIKLVLVTIPATGWGGAGAPASDEMSRSVSPGLSLKYPGYPITTIFESRRLIINHGLPSAVSVAVVVHRLAPLFFILSLHLYTFQDALRAQVILNFSPCFSLAFSFSTPFTIPIYHPVGGSV